MNPSCAKCNKTVYPVEKLNCLDKIWHKACFKCETCNLKLTMKNYKGYNKLPYCNAHYPTTKHTAVADTPENKRLQKNTMNQSAVVYHKDFEKERGHYTAVSDDPETLRLKKSAQQASDIAYKASGPPSETHQRGRVEDFPPPMPQPVEPPQPEPEAPRHVYGGHDRRRGLEYKATYDYTAADEDEVSFVEGDSIINCQVIDEGWMTGTVERTGQHGMIPSNYVEQI